MQNSWRKDADKLTFIICKPREKASDVSASQLEIHDTVARMIGDVNLFLSMGDDGPEDTEVGRVVGELELMIAEHTEHHKGYGRAALLTIMKYIRQHERDILRDLSVLRGADAHLTYLRAKIGKDNHRSLALFESLEFAKTSEQPNYFGEWELRRTNLSGDGIDSLMKKHGVQEYCEITCQSSS